VVKDSLERAPFYDFRSKGRKAGKKKVLTYDIGF